MIFSQKNISSLEIKILKSYQKSQIIFSLWHQTLSKIHHVKSSILQQVQL